MKIVGKSKKSWKKGEKKRKFAPGVRSLPRKFSPDGRDLRTNKINPGGSPEGSQLELIPTLLPYYFLIYELIQIL